MGHWRDGGIGNMPGHDDRPIEQWTLLEKLNALAGRAEAPLPIDLAEPADVAQEAFDEIQRLRTQTIYHSWEPIETAPVPPYTPDRYNAPFCCLLQDEKGNVRQGEGYWAMQGRRPNQTAVLRWRNSLGQCFPKYWMPLPAPRAN